MTADEALDNAARILHEAELERSNLPVMENLTEVADKWINIATLLAERERV